MAIEQMKKMSIGGNGGEWKNNDRGGSNNIEGCIGGNLIRFVFSV